LLDAVLFAYREPPLFYGKVMLWGKCVEHAKGWRSQYARVIGPLTSTGPISEEIRGGLSERYRCEVIQGQEPESVRRRAEAELKRQEESLRKQLDYFDSSAFPRLVPPKTNRRRWFG